MNPAEVEDADDHTHEQQPSAPLELREFTFDLPSKSGKPWATLSLLADAERSSKTNPALVEGTSMTGQVRLDLESGAAIHAVIVTLRGQIITGAHPSEMVPFIELPTVLWSRSMGDPRHPGGKKWTKKLAGKYTWPFSISVPPTVSLPVVGGNEIFRLPPSFFERHTRARIEYEISVKFTRAKLLSDHRLNAILDYLPISHPGPPSGLRQLAYQQHTALLGPDSDPDGWHTLPFVKSRGRLLSSSRSVEVRCRLSLATPLCYTRGTTIPCALVIECGDLRALELLAVPDAVVLRLRRIVRFHARGKNTAPSNDVTLKPVWKEEFEHSEMAAWWPAADRAMNTDSSDTLVNPDQSFRRMLKGEIHLRQDLVTSSSIAHFRIEYSVVLFPFDAQGYESLDVEPLIVEAVEIASDYADGPHPLTYSSPFATRPLATIRA